MGTTATTLHVHHPGNQRVLAAAVISGLETLGWTVVDETGVSDKRILLIGDDGCGFATILDDLAERDDDGTLAALATTLSRALARPALLTALRDSDDFELLLFHDGRQIDAITSASQAETPALGRLEPAARAKTWRALFGTVPEDLPRDLDAVFAEDALAAWCAALGLPAHRQSVRADEAAGLGGALTLLHVARAGNMSSTVAKPPALTPYHHHDDCPHHRVYPAAWPARTDRPFGVKWLALSAGPGFDGVGVEITVRNACGQIRLERLHIAAYPFYNGQITSPNAIAEGSVEITETLAAGRITRSFPGFAVPQIDPDTRRRIVLVVNAEMTADLGAACHLGMTLCAGRDHHVPLAPVRLKATEPVWRPIGSDAHDRSDYHHRLLLQLNEPSVLSAIAILGSDDDATRRTIAAKADAWIAALSTKPGVQATLATEKHMTASGSITKKRVAFSAVARGANTLWQRAFASKSALQTVALDLTAPGYPLPLAGFLLQVALREDAPGKSAAPPHLAFWIVNHPDAFDALSAECAAIRAMLRHWIGEMAPLQGCLTAAAWIPEFDRYDRYEQSLYEDLTAVDWFRSGARGHQMTGDWCRRRLRLVAPEIWLHDDLTTRRVEVAGLADIAETTRLGACQHVALRSGASLKDLEERLAPLLPGSP
ncbi:MAG: hypothetical protein AAF899_13180 [Pseudomonadota bacterium]